jgi:NAD(P) transhydrogenase subunit alpha
MTTVLLTSITVFVLSLLVGFEVISKVPQSLHTPLMSGANAIHGVVVVGVMVMAATTDSVLGRIVLFLAGVFAAMNVVGGYVVTDRMLEMFRAKRGPKP